MPNEPRTEPDEVDGTRFEGEETEQESPEATPEEAPTDGEDKA